MEHEGLIFARAVTSLLEQSPASFPLTSSDNPEPGVFGVNLRKYLHRLRFVIDPTVLIVILRTSAA